MQQRRQRKMQELQYIIAGLLGKSGVFKGGTLCHGLLVWVASKVFFYLFVSFFDAKL